MMWLLTRHSPSVRKSLCFAPQLTTASWVDGIERPIKEQIEEHDDKGDG